MARTRWNEQAVANGCNKDNTDYICVWQCTVYPFKLAKNPAVLGGSLDLPHMIYGSCQNISFADSAVVVMRFRVSMVPVRKRLRRSYLRLRRISFRSAKATVARISDSLHVPAGGLDFNDDGGLGASGLQGPSQTKSELSYGGCVIKLIQHFEKQRQRG
eukprot:1766404-Pyramimonas_sp.AAC.1